MKVGIRGRLGLASAAITGACFFAAAVVTWNSAWPRPEEHPPFGFFAFAALVAAGLNVLLVALATRRLAAALTALTLAAQRRTGSTQPALETAGAEEVEELARALSRLNQDLSATSGNLRSERDLLTAVLEGMDEGVLLLDAAGRVMTVNPKLREMMLLGPETTGRPLLEVVRHADLKELVDHARDHGNSAKEIDLAGIKPRRLLVRAAPLTRADGVLLAVFMDVTDIRRLETMRRDFVANVSHELRTPVASVRSAAETLRLALRKDPEAAPRFIDIIERNADRLQQLIEDLLDLSRIESKEFRLNPEVVDLGAFSQHVVAMFRGRADERKVNLSARVVASEADASNGQMDKATSTLLAQIDRRALEQVVVNLIDNAVKYSPGADVTLDVSRAASELRIRVEDTGPGIEPKHHPRLFERFYRVDPGRARDVGGTGLGLSIVKHLVDAMRGTVTVESVPGKGTTFRIVFPFVEPGTPITSLSLLTHPGPTDDLALETAKIAALPA